MAARAFARRALATKRAFSAAPALPESCKWTPCPVPTKGAADAPVALIFGWTSSTQKQLSHYARVFHACGIDCVTWACPPRQVIDPAASTQVAAELLEALHEAPALAGRPVIFNGISAGAYSCGNLLWELEKLVPDAAERGDFYGRVACGVYDSPVDFEGVPKGVSSAVFGEGSALAGAAQRAIDGYLSLIDTTAWEESSARFHAMAPRAPSVWIYAKNDVISSVATNESIIASWRARGVDVETLVLDESPHVKHIKTAPDAYFRAVHGRVGANYLADADTVPLVTLDAKPAAADAARDDAKMHS